MPTVRFEETWVPGFRAAVRSSTAEGWSVRENRGAMRLQVRLPDQPMQTVVLPFDWSSRYAGDALVRIRNLYTLVQQGHTLRAAVDMLERKAPALVKPWQEAMGKFREQKLHHGNAIKPQTWSKHYEPVIAMAVELLSGKAAPRYPQDLMDQCIRDWEPGSRARQIRAQSLSQFLRFCVEREDFPEIWSPPVDLRTHVGMKTVSSSRTRKGDPLSDGEIIGLLNQLPSDAVGQRWCDSIRLSSELGLRPIELTHLSLRRDVNTGELYWWCSYGKRSGGGMTRPRRLEPLPLVDDAGQVQHWRLMERWQAKALILPPLNGGNCVADCIKTYLNRQTAWVDLRREMAERGRRLVPYSFRHSYSLRCHQRGIDGGSAAAAMGHSYEVHCRSYPWASEAGMVSAFERARLRATNGAA